MYAQKTHVLCVTVHYPFHPHRGKQFRVVSQSREADGWVAVATGEEKNLKIPRWMLAPESATISVTERPLIALSALRRVQELLQLHDASTQRPESIIPEAKSSRKGESSASDHTSAQSRGQISSSCASSQDEEAARRTDGSSHRRRSPRGHRDRSKGKQRSSGGTKGGGQ